MREMERLKRVNNRLFSAQAKGAMMVGVCRNCTLHNFFIYSHTLIQAIVYPRLIDYGIFLA
jgi:hypothetical protein